MQNKLTLKQRQFANEYIANRGNATKAVLKAYDTDNYNTARVMGSENLTKPNISAYIEQLLADSNGLTLDDALESLRQCLHTPLKPTASVGEKLAVVKFLLRLHKAIPEKQPTTTTTTKLTISAQEIAARVAAQEIDITPENSELNSESD